MRIRLVLSLLLLPLAVMACDDVPSGPDTSHVGTYTLQSVNDGALPATVGAEDARFTVQSGTLTLNADSTYTRTTVGNDLAGGGATPTTNTVEGRYQLIGNALTLSAGVTGVVNGNTIRLHPGGDLFLYTR